MKYTIGFKSGNRIELESDSAAFVPSIVDGIKKGIQWHTASGILLSMNEVEFIVPAHCFVAE